MIRRGIVGDVDDAEDRIKRVRPSVRLSTEQRRLVTRVTGKEENAKA